MEISNEVNNYNGNNGDIWCFNSFYFFPDNVGLAVIMLGGTCIIFLPLQLILYITMQRVLVHVVYEKGIYTSYYFGRKLCMIKENDMVFYAIVHARISEYYYADFVLISTEIFEYHEGQKIRWLRSIPKPIIASYDTKKMILLPYEENAPYLSKLSQWTRIYPKAKI